MGGMCVYGDEILRLRSAALRMTCRVEGAGGSRTAPTRGWVWWRGMGPSIREDTGRDVRLWRRDSSTPLRSAQNDM